MERFDWGIGEKQSIFEVSVSQAPTPDQFSSSFSTTFYTFLPSISSKHEGCVRSGGGPRCGCLSFQRGRTGSTPDRCPPVIHRCGGWIRPGWPDREAVGRHQEQEGICGCREQKESGREEVRGHRHLHEGNGVRKAGAHFRQGRRNVDQAHARWCQGRQAKLNHVDLNGRV